MRPSSRPGRRFYRPDAVRSPGQPGDRRQGFTLLEVMLSVAILAMITFAIYTFLSTNIKAITIGARLSDERMRMENLASVVNAQLSALPQSQPGVLLGDTHKFNDLPSDELSWICGPGAGLFTRHASGFFRVRLMIRPVGQASREFELGVLREPALQEGASSGRAKENWLPLLPQVKALEFRYFDPRLNNWVEKWTDQGSRPALVRMRLWKEEDTDPTEVVFALPKIGANSIPRT